MTDERKPLTAERLVSMLAKPIVDLLGGRSPREADLHLYLSTVEYRELCDDTKTQSARAVVFPLTTFVPLDTLLTVQPHPYIRVGDYFLQSAPLQSFRSFTCRMPLTTEQQAAVDNTHELHNIRGGFEFL